MNPGIAKVTTLALVGLLVAACGGGGNISTPARPGPTGAQASPNGPGAATATAAAGGPTAAIDSCALLGEQEIEAATGFSLLEIKSSNLTRVFPSVCDIELVQGGTLTIGIITTGGRSMYENSFEAFIGQGENPPLDRAVEGLGDKAGIADDSDLMVLKGDVLVDILWTVPGISNKEQVLRYVAEVILAKLPCLAQGCPGLTLPPPPPSRAPAFDACSLLTEEEVEDATGIKASTGATFALPLYAGCSWTLESSPLDRVQLTVRETGGREEFDRWAAAFEPPLEHLPGLGDDAIKTGTIPGGSIYAVVGDRLLTLQFSMPSSAEDPYAGYGLVVPLVELALSRLE